tara:strand:+ start:355 stop:627 length:273 start_codon:yes stop_codon:yes gene_type:complete
MNKPLKMIYCDALTARITKILKYDDCPFDLFPKMDMENFGSIVYDTDENGYFKTTKRTIKKIFDKNGTEYKITVEAIKDTKSVDEFTVGG